MPEDPRGYSPGIRAASFHTDNGKLTYQILIMQDKNKITDFQGDMEFLATGRYANGKHDTIKLPPISVALQRYVHAGGGIDLPDGFVPRQVKIDRKSTRLNSSH